MNTWCGNQPGEQEQAGLEKQIKTILTSHPTSLLTEKQQNHKSCREKKVVGEKPNRPTRREEQDDLKGPFQLRQF